jgi:S1-C subfamily serine protease
VAERVAAGIVDVYTTLGYQGGQAAGTGIVISANGDVLTNNHVVEGATKIEAVDLGNGKTYTATVVGFNRSEDIAVIRLRGASGLNTASIGNSDGVRVGDSVLGIGNAGGQGGAPDVAAGTVTALNQSITATDQDGGNAEQLTELIQVRANIQPGDSGGPLVNANGDVIGVDTAASSRYRLGDRRSAGEGFAIPINKAMSIAQQIQSGKASETVHIGESALLGVSVSGNGDGVTVGQVLANGPAQQAGLGMGDVITTLDGKAVDSPTTLTHLMDQHHPGDTVTIGWVDQNQQQHTGTAHLVAGPTG